MKKKTYIALLIIVFLTSIYPLYNLFGMDIEIKFNYGVSIPIADTIIYDFHDEIGRDTDEYQVVKYNSMKLKRIEKLDWQKQIEYGNKELEEHIKETSHGRFQYHDVLYDEVLFNFLKDNNIPKKYYPVIDENTLYFIKDFGHKYDFLLMIYNTKTNIINIYEYHI